MAWVDLFDDIFFNVRVLLNQKEILKSMFRVGLKQANFNVSSKQKSCDGNSHIIQTPLICKGYQDKVSFKKIDGPSEATMAYLQIVKNRELDSLNSLDLNKMMDICKGIHVF